MERGGGATRRPILGENMAYNVYDREEKVFYSEEPKIRHGWLITSSSDSISVCGFSDPAKKAEYVVKAKEVLAGCDTDPELIAAAVMAIEEDHEWAQDVLDWELGSMPDGFLDELHKMASEAE
jgi:hypothetical protein